MTSSLQANIGRAAAGDQRAFAEIYDETIAPAYLLARCIVDDEDLLATCLREAFVQAWREARSWANSSLSAQTWLMVVVRQHAYATRNDACARSRATRTMVVRPALLRIRMAAARWVSH
ncbi:hypothetical protein [Nostocoides sp. Soil756]|jgi:RNA polymerase sigma-70 factor (ECF subfamily)|uniref:hypothetical protein n=1 Tax=Nostocoides sp. Soil756 TaxID=1736399 RepID=UPI0006F5A2CB|nr:hypothetical protein [Tetrasphaera sp. Soil756]KRE61124.1 hypothetical protein ASG78_12310 [Tetrasphaera sp. Soil756]